MKQVLVNLGNRYAVFGPNGGLPEPIKFAPEKSMILWRVEDEIDVAKQRIIETLQVSEMTKIEVEFSDFPYGDVAIKDSEGQITLIDIKVKEGGPSTKEFGANLDRIRQAYSEGMRLEVWFFNIETLNLVIMGLDDKNLPSFEELVPLNVWEKTERGIYQRDDVVNKVKNWIRRIDEFYGTIVEWIGEETKYTIERSRLVTLNEEMMQKYAVAERYIPILDLLIGSEVVVAFVPRGLWLIGASGRVDVITKSGTATLLSIKKEERLEWRLMSKGDRRQTLLLDKSVLLELVKGT